LSLCKSPSLGGTWRQGGQGPNLVPRVCGSSCSRPGRFPALTTLRPRGPYTTCDVPLHILASDRPTADARTVVHAHLAMNCGPCMTVLGKTVLLHEHSGGRPTYHSQSFETSCMIFCFWVPLNFLFNFRVRSWKSFPSIFFFFSGTAPVSIYATYLASLFSPVTLARRRITNSHAPTRHHQEAAAQGTIEAAP
jgi:hypothetical protein